MDRQPETSSSRKSASVNHRFGLRRIEWGTFGLAVLFLGAWVVWAGAHPAEGVLGRALRVGIVQWPGYAGGLVANNGLTPNKDSDFWQHDHKLLVKFVLEPNQKELLRRFALPASNSEALDVIWSTVNSLPNQLADLRTRNVEARAIMQVDWSRGGDAIIATSEIQKIEDLKDYKNKKIAVPKAASQWLFEYSLQHSGLSYQERNDIRGLVLQTEGSFEARQLFVERAVDVAVLWEPDVSQALAQRTGHRLIDTALATNLIADVMVTREDFLSTDKGRQAIAAFIQGWFAGTDKAIGDPALAAKVLQEESDFKSLGETVTRELLGKVVLATMQDNEKMFGFSGGSILFDQIFADAGGSQATEARDVSILRAIYNEQARSVCVPPVINAQLTVPFSQSSPELTQEAKDKLRHDAASLIGAYSGASFWIEGYADRDDDSQDSRNLSHARADRVGDYLAWYCDCPRRQFVAADDPGFEPTKAARYIKLKLVRDEQQQSDRSLAAKNNFSTP